MAKDYYSILGIDKNATDDQIKAAFKKAALKWHPDKHVNDSAKEKKEAEEKFKDINEAYSVLSDPNKKQMYDRYGTTDGPTGFSDFGFNPNDINDIFNIFRNNGPRGRQYQRQHPKGSTINISVALSIEEIYRGGKKTIQYTINTRCKKCNGSGGEDVKECPYCHGTGMITETTRNGYMVSSISRPCNHCKGTGKIVEKECDECHGQGFTRTSKTIDIDIPYGVTNGEQMFFSGLGYESNDPDGPNGDLYITFIYDIDTSRYAVDNNTIYERVDIPYYDAILGVDKKIELPDKEVMTFKIPKCSKNGDKFTVNNRGVNNRKYVATINITNPNSISSKEEDLLNKIRKLHA